MLDKQSLRFKLKDSINQEWVRGDFNIKVDDNIEVVVSERKTIESHGYTLTSQTIQLGDYSIKMGFRDIDTIIEIVETLYKAFQDGLTLEEIIEKYTVIQDAYSPETIREWYEGDL